MIYLAFLAIIMWLFFAVCSGWLVHLLDLSDVGGVVALILLMVRI